MAATGPSDDRRPVRLRRAVGKRPPFLGNRGWRRLFHQLRQRVLLDEVLSAHALGPQSPTANPATNRLRVTTGAPSGFGHGDEHATILLHLRAPSRRTPALLAHRSSGRFRGNVSLPEWGTQKRKPREGEPLAAQSRAGALSRGREWPRWPLGPADCSSEADFHHEIRAGRASACRVTVVTVPMVGGSPMRRTTGAMAPLLDRARRRPRGQGPV